jgi:hypothetical protein
MLALELRSCERLNATRPRRVCWGWCWHIWLLPNSPPRSARVSAHDGLDQLEQGEPGDSARRVLTSQIVHGVGRYPATIHAAGQHLSDILAHFLVDQPV